VQFLGRGPGSRCLRGVLLGMTQLGDRRRQGEQAGDQRGGRKRLVVADPAGQCDDAGYGAERVSVGGAAWDAAVGCAGGAVVGVGGAAQHPAAGHLRRGVQRVGGRPRGVGGLARIAFRAAPDVLRSRGGLAGGVFVDRVPFRGGEPERSALGRACAGAFRAGARLRRSVPRSRAGLFSSGGAAGAG
jgi:hypothetical protein